MRWRALTPEQRISYVERYVVTPEIIAEIEQTLAESSSGLGIPWEQVKAELNKKHGIKDD